MPLQCLIQKWSFEFALFQMFCTVPVNENLHRRRNWSDCEMHFEVLLEATRHDADLGSLQNSSENLSLQSKAEWSCHQFCQTGLSYLISTGSVVADESYYIIYEVTLSRRSPNSEDFSFISVGTHNYEHMFQICRSKVSFPNFLELVSSCLTLRLLSKSWCSCREHPVVLL